MRPKRLEAITLATVLTAVALVGAVTSQTARSVGRSFPGFVIVEDGTPSVAMRSWLDIRFAAMERREVVEVVDQPPASIAEIYDYITSLPIGTPVRYTLRQPDGTTNDQTIDTQRFSTIDYAGAFGVHLVIGCALLLLGISALWRGQRGPVDLAVCSLGLTAGTYCLTGSEIPAASWIALLHVSAGILVPASILHLALLLPEKRLGKQPNLALATVYVPWVALVLVDRVYRWANSSPSPLEQQMGPIHGAALLILLVVSVHDLLSSTSPLVRRRASIAIFGSLAALLLPVLLSVGSISLETSFAQPGAGSVTVLIAPILLYAATRNDPFETDVALRRLATFTAVLSTALAVSAAAILVYRYAGPRSQALVPSPLVIASVTAVALGIFSLIRSRSHAILDRWFDSFEYDGEEALADLSDRLARAHGVASVIGEAEQLFADTFAPSAALVFLEQKGGRLWLQSSDAEKRTELHLPTNMRESLQQGDVLSRIESEALHHGTIPHVWRELGVDLLVPLRGSPLFGVLALGAKRSGNLYSAKDVRFLKAACNQFALGLTKALLFDQMEEDAGISAVLIRAQNEIAYSLNAPDILNRLCQITAAALEMECSHTLLWDTDQDAFVAVSSYGDTPEQAEELRIVRVPRDILGDLPERLESNDALLNRRDQARYHILADMFRYRQSSAIIMPLRREGELIGLHLAGCRNHSPALTPRHERIARGISHASSMALANACLMEELASASRVKSDFVASMSHELRTPLNHIIGYNDLMIDGAFGEISDEQIDTLQRVRRSSHNLLDLIEATLNLSRLDANKVAVDERDVTLRPLVEDLADRLNHSCKKPGVEVEWKIRPEVSTLRTDPVKLQMVLKNLVENGVKFTQRGRVVVEIRIRGDGVEFEVSDTGAGIPKDKRAAIFEPFRRVHDPTASPGVGLGLHIVRRLVDLMQGTITVESEVDLGSRFTVWLPFTPLPPEELARSSSQNRDPMIPLSPTVH